MFKRKGGKIKDVGRSYSISYHEDKSIRSNAITKDEPLEYYFKDGKTLHELFMRGVKVSGDDPCIGRRVNPDLPYIWLSYNQIFQRARWFGSGLISLGASPTPSQYIGIMAPNSLEWIIIEQACNCYSMVIVPFLETLPDESVRHIVEECKLKFFVVDSEQKARKFLSFVTDQLITIDVIVVMQMLHNDVVQLGKDNLVKVVEFSELVKIGKVCAHKIVPPKPEDLHTISYTNDITGTPKGVMLTHKNFSVCASSICALGKPIETLLKASDIYMSYTPLSYPLETVMNAAVFSVGGKVGLYCRNKNNLLSDIQELKPTLFSCPGQVLLKVYNQIISQTSKTIFKKYFLESGLKAKTSLLNKGITSKTTIWDFLVFRQIQKMFGNRVRICFTEETLVTHKSVVFFKCALGAKIISGYGLIETTSIVSYSYPFDLLPRSAGPPLPSMLVKLVDIPEKKNDGRGGDCGEICVKGGNVFIGYFKDEQLTKTVFDEDGWFHTGEIGTWLINGSLKVIDKRKMLIALSDGKRIEPEKLESIFEQIPVIHQVFIYGNNRIEFIVAVVVPNQEMFEEWCSKKFLFGDYTSVVENPGSAKLILEDMKSFGKKQSLEPHEIPQAVHVYPERFTVENGLLTANKKLNRNEIYLTLKGEIELLLY